jgi:hypothetical protein
MRLGLYIVYILFFVSGSLFGLPDHLRANSQVGEKTVSLGGAGTWAMAENRAGITEAAMIRPHPVLLLSAARYGRPGENTGMDLSISFDEPNPRLFNDSTGNYRIIVSRELDSADRRFARAGAGAALFSSISSAPNKGPLIIEPQSRNALFAPNSRIGDFTLEFWFYPMNMENGGQILSWTSSVRNGFQLIQCETVRNRLQWSFHDFFTSADGSSRINISLSGDTPIIPKTWSHHLLRFDAVTGMIEYIVNGRSEAIVYATASGRESNEVYTPATGEDGIFIAGARFMGLMDELKIHNAFISDFSIDKYNPRGGRMETRAIDLGEGNNSVLRVDAGGGRTSVNGTRVVNEYSRNGRFLFSDDSQMQFFIRASNNPYSWDGKAWKSFIPGTDFSAEIKGRYVQLAVDFYPSADGLASPYLEELRITFIPGEPPLPPQFLTAVAVDGAVMLRWRNSPNINTEGYLVYYSDVRGEYFGEDALLGPSPVDAGKRNSLFIDGLKNGTLYYFRVAAYIRGERSGSPAKLTGDFSREVTARPLTGLTLHALRTVE